jgi:hypothetical protein
MLHRAANRIRTTLDALEAREVCFAGVSLGIPLPVMGPVPPAAVVAPVVQVGPSGVGPSKDLVGHAPAAKPAPRLSQVDSVITLRNDTATPIRFSVRWAGSTGVTWYALAPGQAERVTFRQAEKVRPNLMAAIQYGPEGGGSVRKAQVASAPAAVGDDGTSQGDSRVYSFRPTAAGVGLFAAAPGLAPPPSPYANR